MSRALGGFFLAAVLLLVALVVVAGPARPATAAPPRQGPARNSCTIQFTDVTTGTYFYDPVLWLACRGAVSGYADGSFGPYQTTTRGQLTKIVVLAYGWPLLNPASGHFSDVPSTAPFYSVIETAYARGIIGGYADGTFRPNDLVTRGQISKIVTLGAGWTPLTPATGHFADAPPGSPFYTVIETAVAHGLISGYGDGTFRPYNSATRSQVAKIVYLDLEAGCTLFPANNIWNRDISTLPVDPNSAVYITTIGATGHLHAGFGSGLYQGAPLGIPWIPVAGSQVGVTVTFRYSADSDPGPYPVPTNAPIQGGAASTGDRHVVVVDQGGNCTLYEMFGANPQPDGSWQSGAGARWDLSSNALRPDGWTAATDSGLPILPGLARYEEVAGGAINHALLFTASSTAGRYLWPARHATGLLDPTLPPMGLRLRLKAGVDLSGYSPAARVILTALKQYGMFLGDTGTSWTLGGTTDERWDNDVLAQLGGISGTDFEVVDESGLMVDPNSGEARP